MIDLIFVVHSSSEYEAQLILKLITVDVIKSSLLLLLDIMNFSRMED